MRVLKKIKDIEIYKFGIISPVLHDNEMVQREYFNQLSQKGVMIPPGSGDTYYFKVSTFKGWLRRFRQEGLDGLKYRVRRDKGNYKKMSDYVKQAVESILQASEVQSVSDLYRKLILNGYIQGGDISYETLRKYVKERRLLNRKDLKVRKKFEKELINQLWMVDFKQGKSIRVGKQYRRTYLCAIIDDCSRVLVGYEWGLREDTALFARVLKKAIMIYGIPMILYCDQAKVFKSNYIVQLCGRLGISLAHAQPYSPASKGKIERFNRTVIQMFYPVVQDFSALCIDSLNQLFSKFINEIYHVNPHSGIGKPPLKKFQELVSKTQINRINQKQLEQFFLCSINRRVRQDATVRINKVDYQVGMKYVGEMVDIRFPVDEPDRFYLFDNDEPVAQLKAVDLKQNANPPYISTSYSKLSVLNQDNSEETEEK
jgi:putative transposase